MPAPDRVARFFSFCLFNLFSRISQYPLASLQIGYTLDLQRRGSLQDISAMAEDGHNKGKGQQDGSRCGWS